MTKRWLAVLLVALLVCPFGPARAAEPSGYPASPLLPRGGVLIDLNCADTKASSSTAAVAQTFVEDTTGAGANKRCDGDRRILTGSQLANATWGPFDPGSAQGVYLHVLNSAAGGNYALCIFAESTYEPGAIAQLGCTSGQTAGGAIKKFLIGTSGVAVTASDITGHVSLPLPRRFYIQLQITTSWSGDISIYPTN